MKKAGRPKNVKTPEEMLILWDDYKSSILEKSKEWPKVQYVGKDGIKKTDYPKMPLTVDGFEVYCYDLVGCVGQYFDNKDKLYNDYVAICSRIRKECRADQINGGMLGFYNPSITQRLNNLVDQKSTEIKGGLNIPNLPDIGGRK